ncbi:hypothetical protein RAS1_27680 [Phycisphaerae bacterium RAS1]|nr:hypothetical protein RAS1_27680 [Phycisphaerae bacterium RAS1]
MNRVVWIGGLMLTVLSYGCASHAPPRYFMIDHRRVHEVITVKAAAPNAKSADAGGFTADERAMLLSIDGEILETKPDEYRAFVITFEDGPSNYRFSFVLLGPATRVQVGVDAADLYVMSGFIYIRGHWGRVRGERVFAGTTGSTLMMQVDTSTADAVDRVFFEAGASAGIERINNGYRDYWSDKTKYKEITRDDIYTRTKPGTTDPLGTMLSNMRKAAVDFDID